ncbi:type IX secretion system sortase PorU [Mesonia sp. K7]|uniref:type IX secretion system sortase PorU n=1 Tax=Mesonia sp. K7 TaxID=2218606 RepID=UPI000DA6E1E2|nr:type IX secretion system sortase PorU [Mesonia sp. K7]PZD77157.1 peptidase C25 [Mesonia sp. K7]
MRLLFLLFLFTGISAFAQQKSFEIIWEEEVKKNSTAERNTPAKAFNALLFTENPIAKEVTYHQQWQESGYVGNYNLAHVTYTAVTQKDLAKINVDELPAQPELTLSQSFARETSYFVLSLQPFVRQNGMVRKVKSFTVNYNKTVSRTTFSSNPPMQNSVLASGNWARFYVPKSGVYKISRSFLNSLGFNVNDIDPRTLKIYGHGGEMLPLLNGDNQHYDIPETSIQVVGENDGSFDGSDYILFYGKAVHDTWSPENFTTQNLYADRSYYYITYGGSFGLRVDHYIEPTSAPTITISTFDDEQFHEVDETSIAKVGRKWVGETFAVNNEQTFDFTFNNIVGSEPVTVRGAFVAVSESATSVGISVNDQQGQNIGLSAISGDYDYAREGQINFQQNISSDGVEIKITFNNNGNPASVGYLDHLRILAKRQLNFSNQQEEFTFIDAATSTGIAQYNLQISNNISQIWDITNRQNIRSLNTNGVSNFNFKANLGQQRKYIAIAETDFYVPLIDGNPNVDNQNLKGNVFKDAQGNFQDVDYLIFTNNELMSQAQRLAGFRRTNDGLRVKVVDIEDVYTEFNSGKQDVGAIRNFIKYVYDNASTLENRIKYVGIIGDGSVDYKDRLQNNSNIVPVFERLESYTTLPFSTSTDDFYGMMDANEGIMGGSQLMDIAVGRIIAKNISEAKIQVDKIIDYEGKKSYGRWRNNFVLFSDDADSDSDHFLQVDLDAVGDDISANKPFVNVIKLHSDAYQQVSESGGERYPKLNDDLNSAIEVGATVINYFGHGGINGLAQERLVTEESIESWNNEDRYNVFVTITCDLARFDNPLLVTPGEVNLLKEKSGSVAMVTTTRAIFVSTGVDFNEQFAPFLFNYAGTDDAVAEAVRKAKNMISGSDKRAIAYLGDPAMKLQLPKPQVVLTAVNDIPITQSMDTIKALGKVKIAGQVVNASGAIINNYDGELSTTIYDKRIDRVTLNNDNNDNGVFNFTTLGEIIFRGKASVTNGLFSFEFVAPKDIDLAVGNGRISFYSERNGELEDQKGYNNDVLVGGLNENAPEDNQGPQIELFMNDESFISGGITNDSPILIAKLYDENGINTASGIGHDLVAILDGDETNPYVVNDFYETELDDYTRGLVNFKFRDLEEGLHTLSFKAWDVYNNSSIAEIQFIVAGDDKLKITKVLNYPNPFLNYTEFWFSHNRPFEPLEVQVQVFTVSGKIVWTKNQIINTDGFLSREITWDGKDDFGDKIGKGVYVYKLTVKSTLTNKKVEKFEKLVIL